MKISENALTRTTDRAPTVEWEFIPLEGIIC